MFADASGAIRLSAAPAERRVISELLDDVHAADSAAILTAGPSVSAAPHSAQVCIVDRRPRHMTSCRRPQVVCGKSRSSHTRGIDQ